VIGRFRKPPTVIRDSALSRNHLRFRISPQMTIAVGTTVMAQTADLRVENVEMVATRYSSPDAMDAYERVLGDAMAGDATFFARQDYVEEAWRIVDPLLKAATPIYEYEIATWGPIEVDQRVAPAGGWHNPVASDHEDIGVDRGGGCDGRDVRATGRASPHPGRERGTVMTSSISRFPLTRRHTMHRHDGRQEIDRRTTTMPSWRASSLP
jgi:hypothetical protein